MKKINLFIILLVMCSSSALAQSGSVTIHFGSTYALDKLGQPDFTPLHNRYCRDHVGASFQAEPIKIDYAIDQKSSFQTSRVTFLDHQVALYPEGLTDRYAFMSDGVGALDQSKIIRVIVNFDKSLQIASSFILFDTDQGFNCAMMGVGPVS